MIFVKLSKKKGRGKVEEVALLNEIKLRNILQ